MSQLAPHPRGAAFCRARSPVAQLSLFRGREEVGPVAGARLPRRRPRNGKGRFMREWLTRVGRFLRDEDGPTAVEYAVMLALIVVVCIAAITTLGPNASSTFSNVALNQAAGSGGS